MIYYYKTVNIQTSGNIKLTFAVFFKVWYLFNILETLVIRDESPLSCSTLLFKALTSLCLARISVSKSCKNNI